MHEIETYSTFTIVAAVVLFFLLGIAIIVIIDHKSRLPGGFTSNPFSIIGLRRDHPFLAFITATILLSIIAALILEMVIALGSLFGLDELKKEPELLTVLTEHRTEEQRRHFHHFPDDFKPIQGKKNICLACHGDFPHSKKPMIRTINNMHTQFIGCLTCHADPKKIPEESLDLRWLNFSGIKVTGPKFGTDIDKKTGLLVETDDYFSRIVAYQKKETGEELLEIVSDDPRMKEFEKIKNKLSDADREAVKKRFHKSIMSKGRACSRCHTEESKSFIPFRKLGFSERRTFDLTNLNIVGLIEKYKSFYMPNLMGTEKADSPGRTKASGNSMKRDPRSWWKEMYDSPAKK